MPLSPFPMFSRRYHTSKFRVLHLAILLGVVLLAVSRGYAQEAADTAAAPNTIPSNPFLLLLQTSVTDPISILIILLSVIAVALIIQSALRVRRSVLNPPQVNDTIREMIEQRRFKDLIEFTEQDDSFVSASLNPALRRAPSFAAMREALETQVSEETAEEFRKLEYINILANVGPLLGLMGTVYGIMKAFVDLAGSGGNADPGQLASGISVALGTTLLGLILAVPCLVAYGIFRNRADKLTTEAALQTEEFLLMMKPDDRPSTPAAPRSVAKPAAVTQPRPAT